MSNLIARTGRVQSWIDNPESRLPVSCTVFNVEDSFSGSQGIDASLKFVSHALRFGAGCAIHLSDLRPKGTENGKGLTASGPVSFAKIYSTLNEVIRRGGVYKNGAICLHMALSHADINEFITAPRSDLPWAKRCVDINHELWDKASTETKTLLLRGIHSGDIWLNKIRYDRSGKQIFGNVCLEIYIKSRGTCLLEHLNLGACTIGDIPKAFVEGMTELCELHRTTGVGDSGEYLTPEEDRQVGLGILGLANCLAYHKVTYEEFGLALRDLNNGMVVSQTTAGLLARAFDVGIHKASVIARTHGMQRAFTIAPTASCSYNYKDLKGYTTTPEIAPPIYSKVDRDSGTFGVTSYDYGDVEIASEVGWDTYKLVADELMRLYNNSGLMHGYSFNTWSDVVTYDEAFIEDWLKSPQTSMYYALQVQPETQRKDDASAVLDEDYKDIFNLEEPQFCAGCAE